MVDLSRGVVLGIVVSRDDGQHKKMDTATKEVRAVENVRVVSKEHTPKFVGCG